MNASSLETLLMSVRHLFGNFDCFVDCLLGNPINAFLPGMPFNMLTSKDHIDAHVVRSLNSLLTWNITSRRLDTTMLIHLTSRSRLTINKPTHYHGHHTPSLVPSPLLLFLSLPSHHHNNI